MEKYTEARAADLWCQVMATKVDEGQRGRFKRDDRGFLVRIAPYDLVKLLEPQAPRPRVLHLAHYTRLVGQPRTARMYQSLRHEFYWPCMALEVVHTERSCTHCA